VISTVQLSGRSRTKGLRSKERHYDSKDGIKKLRKPSGLDIGTLAWFLGRGLFFGLMDE
jgi:hypothetical protein